MLTWLDVSTQMETCMPKLPILTQERNKSSVSGA